MQTLQCSLPHEKVHAVGCYQILSLASLRREDRSNCKKENRYLAKKVAKIPLLGLAERLRNNSVELLEVVIHLLYSAKYVSPAGAGELLNATPLNRPTGPRWRLHKSLQGRH